MYFYAPNLLAISFLRNTSTALLLSIDLGNCTYRVISNDPDLLLVVAVFAMFSETPMKAPPIPTHAIHGCRALRLTCGSSRAL